MLVRVSGAILEIPALASRESNVIQLSWIRTVSDGQFYWGGILLKSNGGVPSLLYHGW
jgi:hypothetical protein